MSTDKLISKLLDKLERQDEFILSIFNDERVNTSVKSEWLEKYNSLKIKATDL